MELTAEPKGHFWLRGSGNRRVKDKRFATEFDATKAELRKGLNLAP
jgi:hypothetical protein